MVSVKGLSLGKNEDPKKRGSGQAKQISLDGLTVSPSTGSTKIEEPKILNARWYGETAVTPAALTQIPQLELPSVAGVIENATPKDAGAYAEAFSDFAGQVNNFGSAMLKRNEKIRKEDEAIAFNIINRFGEGDSPVKKLETYISKIEKDTERLKNKEVLNEIDKQQILDNEKLIRQINKRRNLGEVLLSQDRERVVINRAMTWPSHSKTVLVPDTDLNGDITDKNGELKSIPVTDLDPKDARYIKAFNDYVYGGIQLSAFELKNVEPKVSNALYNSMQSQDKVFNDKQKDKILNSSMNNITLTLKQLKNSGNTFDVANFITGLNNDIDFLKNTHMFTREEQQQFISNIIAQTSYYLGEAGFHNTREIIETMFLGKNLGTEDQVFPLMVGPLDERVNAKDGTLNKKLRLVDLIGGEAQLNILIGQTEQKNLLANERSEKSQQASYENSFETILRTPNEGGKGTLFTDIIMGATDNIKGNVYVQTAITALNKEKEKLIIAADGDQDKIFAISKAYNQKLNDIKYNLAALDYTVEKDSLTSRSYDLLTGSMTKAEEELFKEDLELFKDNYKGLPKLQEDLRIVNSNLVNSDKQDFRSITKSANDFVKSLFNTWADKEAISDENYDEKTVWNSALPSIQKEVSEIIEDANAAFPNDIDQRNNYVMDEIQKRWDAGRFIEGRRKPNTSPFFGSGDYKNTLKKFTRENGYNKDNADADGKLIDTATFSSYINSPNQPIFTKKALVGNGFTSNKFGGLLASWMSGEDMPEGWTMIEKNLYKIRGRNGTYTIDEFLIDQLVKAGIPMNKIPVEEIKEMKNMNQEQRRKHWEEVLTK